MIIASAVMMTGRRRVIPAASAACIDVAPDLALIVGEGHDEDAVGGGHADAHDRPHERRHAQRSVRQEEHPGDPRDARRAAPSG